MQTSFLSFLAAFAAAAGVLPTALASPTNMTLHARGALPAKDKAYLCNQQSYSAGVSNIKLGALEISKLDKDCAPGDKGEPARMVAGGGYSFFMASVGGEKVGSIHCPLLADVFVMIADNCGGPNNDDYRAGGVAWVPGYEGLTYVYPTADSLNP
ncbi:hypothetical protein F4778DRAFT_731119 [Xylariomycetidae sp. FL2044]|nr:hypothetical protein F4778DRAFT_731119 [Xylariomycetidae sp. FL2044]